MTRVREIYEIRGPRNPSVAQVSDKNVFSIWLSKCFNAAATIVLPWFASYRAIVCLR